MPRSAYSHLKPILMTCLLFLVFVGGLPFSIHIAPERANAASFTLIGRIASGTLGWGFTKISISSPGPDLTVQPGETVSVTLASADASGIPHTWGVDYNNDTLWEPSEPQSAQFTSIRNSTFTFTATNTPGTYLYYCFIHGVPMYGHFIVLTPAADVAVTSITSSRSFAYNGVSLAHPILVNVTALNVGSQTQTFFVSAKANATLIGNQTTTLTGGQSSVVSFQWFPSSLSRGVYFLSGQASKVPNEVNTLDNFVAGNSFNIKLRGDVSGDCKVDIVDLATVGSEFGKTAGQVGYNPNADLNNDGVINIIDLVVIAGNFGQAC